MLQVIRHEINADFATRVQRWVNGSRVGVLSWKHPLRAGGSGNKLGGKFEIEVKILGLIKIFGLIKILALIKIMLGLIKIILGLNQQNLRGQRGR